MAGTLHLPISYSSRYDAAVRKCKLHPVVIFEILDHFVRRNENQERVIGTLLGINLDGVIEFRSSFPVPYIINEDGMIDPDIEFHRSMYEHSLKASPHELIVGWYSTGLNIDENSVFIHDFYWREMAAPPVHVMVNPLNTDDFMGIRAYIAAPLGITQTEKLGFVFQSIELDFETQNIEKTGIDILVKGMRSNGSILKDLDNLGLSFKRLLNLLEAAEHHVKNVLEGKQKEDAQIGRMLWDTVSSLPKVDAASFEQMWNNSMTDLLMIVYLANITKSQVITTEQQHTLPTFKTTQKNTKG